MSWTARILLALGFVMLMYGTVAVFIAFDSVSHSNSDTLRPFIITMAPVWAIAIAGALALRRGNRQS